MGFRPRRENNFLSVPTEHDQLTALSLSCVSYLLRHMFLHFSCFHDPGGIDDYDDRSSPWHLFESQFVPRNQYWQVRVKNIPNIND